MIEPCRKKSEAVKPTRSAQIERQVAGSIVYGLTALFKGGCPRCALHQGDLLPDTPASSATQGPQTLAWFVFGENVDRRVAQGMACLAAGALILSWSEAPSLQNILGPLAILLACVAWGLDNNLTRKASLAD